MLHCQSLTSDPRIASIICVLDTAPCVVTAQQIFCDLSCERG